ncbi:MAG: helix-turn-helix domain-containing protein [bacterium]
MELHTLLQNFGLNEKQAQIYLTLLQMGSGNIQEICKKSKIKRTTTYSVLDTLIAKGVVTVNTDATHREYYAENPKKMPRILGEEAKKMIAQQKSLLEALPELTSLYNTHATKPKIRLFEGIEGLKEIYEETLIVKQNSEIIGYHQLALMHKHFDDTWINGYNTSRKEHQISQRAIVEDSAFARAYRQNDTTENRETRLIPEDKYPFKNENLIFGAKLAIISFKDLLGVIIESADVAQTQRSIFELAWLGTEHMSNE